MRYCVAHDEYFLDSVGKIIRTEMAECSRRRTLFLVPAGDIADSTTCAFEKERGESNDRNGIPVFPRRCLHFVWFSRTQAKHLIAEIRNWLKKTYEDCTDIIVFLCCWQRCIRLDWYARVFKWLNVVCFGAVHRNL